MIVGHNEDRVVMRCTNKKCELPQKWMCLEKCKDLHDDHAKDCLTIDKLAEAIRANSKMFLFPDRKLLLTNIVLKLDE